jgi:hypothetical protein
VQGALAPVSSGESAIDKAYAQYPDLFKGIPIDLAKRIAGQESSYNPNAKAKTSTATGLFQIIDSTWDGLVDRYGHLYGIEGDQRKDPMANTLMIGHYFQDTTKHMRRALGRELTRGEIYAGNHFGAGGAVKLLTAHPDTPTSEVWGSDSAAILKANAHLRNKTAGEVRRWLERVAS